MNRQITCITISLSKERKIHYRVIEKVELMSQDFKDGVIPVDDLYSQFTKEEHKEVEEVLYKMQRAGDIYEPRRGFIKKI